MLVLPSLSLMSLIASGLNLIMIVEPHMIIGSHLNRIQSHWISLSLSGSNQVPMNISLSLISSHFSIMESHVSSSLTESQWISFASHGVSLTSWLSVPGAGSKSAPHLTSSLIASARNPTECTRIGELHSYIVGVSTVDSEMLAEHDGTFALCKCTYDTGDKLQSVPFWSFMHYMFNCSIRSIPPH